MKKRLVSLVLTLAMMLSLSVGITPAQAADYTPQFTEAAEMLNAVGLFRGTGKNPDGTPIYDLDKPATRMQGLIMLIRLLGEEDEALAYEGPSHFTDLSGNAAKYGDYAYSKGYTRGNSATTFGNGPLKANAFLTFVLRALGYSDKEGDFTYATAFAKAADLGIIAPGEYTDQSKAIYRDACAQISHNALITCPKGEDRVLQDCLVEQGVIDGDAAEKAGLFTTVPMYGDQLDMAAYDAGHANLMAARVKYAAKDAVYYGLPADIQWIAEPKTEEEFLNNVYCCFLVGNYSLSDLAVHHRETAEGFVNDLFNNIHELAACNPELMGAYCNGDAGGGFGSTEGENGYFRANMDLFIDNASLTDQEIYRRQEVAKEAAYALSKQMHDSGKIKEGMTQKQIAQVYYDYFQRQGIKPSSFDWDNEDRGVYMQYDTVYAAIINKVADCMGRCAVFNVMMHIEGISAQSLSCHPIGAPEGANHVLNRVVLDGEEYVCDWGNRLPIQTLKSAEAHYEFFDFSLELARSKD